MTDRSLDDWAEHIAPAYRSVAGGPTPETLTGEQTSFPQELNALSDDDAYGVQRRTIDLLNAEYGTGDQGYKISIASREDQASIDASEPTYGVLTDAHLKPSGYTVALDQCNGPLVEPEVLVRTKVELSGDPSIEQIMESVELGAGLEMPVARFLQWQPTGPGVGVRVPGLIADNSLAGFVFVGENWIPALDPAELAEVTVEAEYPDGEKRVGRADRVVGTPYGSTQWLVRALTGRGQVLPAGSIVSAGTLMPPYFADPGDYVARFSHGIGEVRFTAI